MRDDPEDIGMPTIFQIRDQEYSIKTGMKPPTMDELKTRIHRLASYLRKFEDDYDHTDDPSFARAYEDLHQRYVDLREFYVGAVALLHGMLSEHRDPFSFVVQAGDG